MTLDDGSPARGLVSSCGLIQWGRLRLGRWPQPLLTATLADGKSVWTGAFRGTKRSDAAPLTVPMDVESCSLVLPLRSQPTYRVRGKTSAGGPDRTLRLQMTEGDAFPFEQRTTANAAGNYVFPHTPAGRYQFFAGWTGSGIEVFRNIDDLDIAIRWPEVTDAAPDISGDETRALHTLQSIGTALRVYVQTYGIGLPAALTARPTEYGKDGRRSFLLDESNVIRATGEDRDATATDFIMSQYFRGDLSNAVAGRQ
ncbi:MAG: hypothetical protein JNM66_33285 [Bryobacterales bacterium]|nr:hypothetical protein [Bryobacterales bacterium]